MLTIADQRPKERKNERKLVMPFSHKNKTSLFLRSNWRFGNDFVERLIKLLRIIRRLDFLRHLDKPLVALGIR